MYPSKMCSVKQNRYGFSHSVLGRPTLLNLRTHLLLPRTSGRDIVYGETISACVSELAKSNRFREVML